MTAVITDIVGKDVEETQKHLINHIKLCNRSIEKISEQLENNTKAIISLKKETRDVINLYKDIQNATRFAKNLQNFAAWVIKWPLIGGGIAYIYSKVIESLID